MTTRAMRRRVYDAKMNLTRRSHVMELRRLAENERLSAEELTELQRDRALAMARHARLQSPFYRELYRDAGLTADDFRDPAVLDALPFAEKPAVRENFASISTPEATSENTVPQHTGGSTGHPTKVLHDKRAMQHLLAYRLHSWWGVEPSDNRALAWRVGFRPSAWRDRFGNVLSWPMRTIQIDANHMGPAELEQFLDGWARARPALLVGYTGTVLDLARLVQQDQRALAPPLAVATTASPISAGEKAYLTEVFRAPAYDHYQSIEVPIMAGECEQANGLHVFSDARWVEVVDDEGKPVGPGETGSVVVTDLSNRAFPFVRYQIGDRASWKTEPCPCGRPFPQLDPIGGRTTDNFVLPSGRFIMAELVAGVLAAHPGGVRQYQACQHADLSVTLRYVPGPTPPPEAVLQGAVDEARHMLGDEVPVRIEAVDEIPHDRGKQRVVVRENADGTVAPPPSTDSGPVLPQPTVSTDSTSRSSPVATS